MPAEIRVAARYCSIASRYAEVVTVIWISRACSETAVRSFCPTSRKLRSASFGDYGATPVIANPATGVTLLLDRAKQQVRAIPTPPGMTPQVTPPGVPGMPSMTPPTPPAMQLKDLGIKMVQGIEVQGKQITLPPLAAPKPPAPPHSSCFQQQMYFSHCSWV
jgi:hypothetical protein